MYEYERICLLIVETAPRESLLPSVVGMVGAHRRGLHYVDEK